MEINEQRGTGLSLIIGSILMVVTMVLHPVGGSFQQLLKIATMGIISHSIAIISVPFVAYGFWGLSKRLSAQAFLSNNGFSVMCFGLIAAMIAAIINGLTLTGFVKSYEGASQETIASLKPIFVFMRSFNHAFDYVFIGAACLSMALLSLAILKTKAIRTWIGYFGLILPLACFILFLSGFELLDLLGFRIVIFGYVSWVLSAGYYLTRPKS